MGNKLAKRWALWVFAITFMALPGVKAQGFSVNELFVRGELYVYNRVADLFEVVRCGVAAGPAIGAEIAITEYAQLGAYAANEKGVSFPHFIPPLWLVPYFEDQPIFRVHQGLYKTVSFGPKRRENRIIADERFHRGPWDVRAQAALGLVHLYANVETTEIGDFFAGFAGFDPKGDDAQLDPTARRKPIDQLGRGVCNVATGIIEIPFNMVRVNEEQGDLAGATTGLFRGTWRFLIREVVGVTEIVTFPFGWDPIVEPAYPFEPARNTDWRVNPLPFKKRY
jgi:putative exosortase-associated protein (TIGR04073 family)